MEIHNGGGDKSQTHLNPGDEFVLYCGGKPGLLVALQKPFEKRKKEVKPVTLMYSRDDMQCRREKTQSGAINQIEMQLRIAADFPQQAVEARHALQMLERRECHWADSAASLGWEGHNDGDPR